MDDYFILSEHWLNMFNSCACRDIGINARVFKILSDPSRPYASFNGPVRLLILFDHSRIHD